MIIVNLCVCVCVCPCMCVSWASGYIYVRVCHEIPQDVIATIYCNYETAETNYKL